MTFRDFEIFVTVCDTMNMTAAAERLFISQSAISQVINEIEKCYDVRLFERLSRKIYLTQAGEKMLSYARHILGTNAMIEREMKDLSENGMIRFGVSLTIGANIMPALVSAFRQSNPLIDITVFEDNTQSIEKRLLADETDIGLVEGQIKSPDIVSSFFADDELTLICGRGHRFAALAAVAPRELEKEDFIVREPGSGTRKTFEDAMSAHKFLWNAKWECSNTGTIKEAVMAGLGVSVISRIEIQKELSEGRICAIPIKGVYLSRTFKMAWHKNKYLTPSMKKFIDFCGEKSTVR